MSKYVVMLTEFLLDFGLDVVVITSSCETTCNGLVVRRTPPVEDSFFSVVANVLHNSRIIQKERKELGVDVFHSQGTYSFLADVVTMHSCHKAAIKAINRISAVEYNLVQRPLYRTARWVLPLNVQALIVEKKVLEKSKKIISVSEGVKKEILDNYNISEEKINVIPNGVDLNEFKPNKEKRGKTREQLKIDENEVVLMFSGYEFKRKGLRYIIEALPKIKGDVKLLVVGKDDPEPYRKLASKLGVIDKVIFMGFVQDISECYAASDIFVFPTLYEAFSLVTLEAVASGLPILATKVNGTEELIVNGYNGFFIERDGNDIAEKVNILVDDDGLRKKMSKNARKTARNYSWEKVARKTLEVYEEVVKR